MCMSAVNPKTCTNYITCSNHLHWAFLSGLFLTAVCKYFTYFNSFYSLGRNIFVIFAYFLLKFSSVLLLYCSPVWEIGSFLWVFFVTSFKEVKTVLVNLGWHGNRIQSHSFGSEFFGWVLKSFCAGNHRPNLATLVRT